MFVSQASTQRIAQQRHCCKCHWLQRADSKARFAAHCSYCLLNVQRWTVFTPKQTHGTTISKFTFKNGRLVVYSVFVLFDFGSTSSNTENVLSFSVNVCVCVFIFIYDAKKKLHTSMTLKSIRLSVTSQPNFCKYFHFVRTCLVVLTLASADWIIKLTNFYDKLRVCFFRIDIDNRILLISAFVQRACCN